MKRFNIDCPFFPGFYESWAFNYDTEYNAIKNYIEYGEECGYIKKDEKTITEDDLMFDYENYKKDFCNSFIKSFIKYTPEFVGDNVMMVKLTSPTYYNYSTDKLGVIIEVQDGWEDAIRTFIDEHYDWLKKRIHSEWSSCSGFWSFIFNDVDDWYDKIVIEDDARYFGEIIKYMMFVSNPEIYDDLMYDTLGDICADLYVKRVE